MKKKMRLLKRFVLLTAVGMLFAMFSACGQKNESVLNIYTWETYFPDDVIKEFEETTGIEVRYSNFTSNEEMLAKLQAVGGGEYDIVLASDYIIDIARKEGLLAELNKSKIPNYQNINPAFQNQFFDPDNLYTVPYSAGTPLIIYDPAKVDIEITGYESLWNPALKDSVVIMDDARNVIGITLRTMGKTLNETDPEILAQAKEKLVLLKPNIALFDYNSPQTAMISGEATVGYMFTSQIVESLAARPDLQVVYPSEGLGWGIDSIFVPVKAPNQDNAAAFIDFILDAERGAKISEAIGYICCNKAAEDYMSPAYKNNPVLNIPQSSLVGAQMVEDIGETATLYDQIWVEFKQ